ncbi:extracellular solute-binding protein [Undibacterium piscinae]|jgi:putative chitobiose transport system substrate-binding protein|uniref:Extracellular solute-binding protein n=1 Tax=Undibacterium piscinae TaxID=2495591 RepID=A0A6M4A7U8_9BURK|nr:extracellular solute-binding protein [Undibacterium piscinae]
MGFRRFSSLIWRLGPRFALQLTLLLGLLSGAIPGVPGIGASAHAAAPEKIEFWTMSLKPKFIPYFQTLVSKYEAQHPGVKVEWVDFPWDILQLKLITAIAAGTPPSLVNLSVPWAEELARDGLIIPVEHLMRQPPIYTKGALDDLRFNAHIYGFPHYSNVNVIAYNKRILTAAGIRVAPKNMDELLAYARQIAARTGKAGYAPALGKIDGFMMQQGLQLIKDGKAIFNSPAHVALVRKLAMTYAANGFLKDKLFAEDNFPAVVDAYLGGRLGMMVSAPTALRRIQADSREVYALTDIFPVPRGPTGIADGGWMFNFAVPKGVAQKQLPAIASFAEFLSNDENQLEFAKIANVMPTTIKALADPYFQQLPAQAQAAEKAQAVAAASMDNSRSLYVAGIEDYDELRRFLVKAVEAGVTGKKDIQLALDEAAAIWNRKLAKQAR